MGIQLLGMLFIFSWSFSIAFVFFYAINYMGWYRVDPLEEEAGMDISIHKGTAYDIVEPEKVVVDAMRSSRHGRLSIIKKEESTNVVATKDADAEVEEENA